MRKFARLIVLGVAIAAGGSAAWLANGLQPAEQETLQVKPQVVTVDVMVAAKDLPAGSKISDTEFAWQEDIGKRFGDPIVLRFVDDDRNARGVTGCDNFGSAADRVAA